MKNFFATVFGLLGVVGVLALSFVVIALYVLAFEEGAKVWFGWEGWWVFSIAFVLIFLIRGIGFLIVGVVGGYGAYYGWDWSIWLCVIVFFPGIPLAVGSLFFSALDALFSRNSE